MSVDSDQPVRGGRLAQSEGTTPGAVGLPVQDVVPQHLLDGSEVVHFAIKPSPWFVVLVSLRWLLASVIVFCFAWSDVVGAHYRPYLIQFAMLIAAFRMALASLDWVSRLYVLTNRRVMSIQGRLRVELFECSLDRIQNTFLSLSPPERLVRVGTVAFETASGSRGGLNMGSWRMVARPLEVHEKLLAAIDRAKNRGNNGN